MIKQPVIRVVLVLCLLSCLSLPVSSNTTGFNETHEYASLVSEIKPYPQLEIVTKVDGFKDFKPHWNNRFPQGSTLMVYADALDVSHARFIILDFIFVIKDPRGHIVSWDRVKVRRVGYDDNAYVVYTKTIPSDWIDGPYTIRAFVYDRADFATIMRYEYNYTSHIGDKDFWDDFWDLDEDDDDDDDGGTFVKPLSESRVIMRFREKTFYVDHRASEYPPDWFAVSGLRVLPEVVAPGEEAYVTVNVTNTYKAAGRLELICTLDNSTIGSKKLSLDPYTTTTLDFTIPPLVEGEHQLRIISPSAHVAGTPMTAILNVSMEGAEEATSELPTSFIIKSLDIKKIRVKVNESVPIAVTVQNKGREGNGTVQLMINGKLEGERNLSLRYLERRTIYFNVTESNPGTYRVTIPGTGFSRLFFVTEEVEEASSIFGSLTSKTEEKKVSVKTVTLLIILLIALIGFRVYLAMR